MRETIFPPKDPRAGTYYSRYRDAYLTVDVVGPDRYTVTGEGFMGFDVTGGYLDADILRYGKYQKVAGPPVPDPPGPYDDGPDPGDDDVEARALMGSAILGY